MDFWNWAGIVCGLAIAVHELCPLVKSWRTRDREWWSGFFWGCVGLFVAVSSLVSGLKSAADAKATEGRIAALEPRFINQPAAVPTLKQFAGVQVELAEVPGKEATDLASHMHGLFAQSQWNVVGRNAAERLPFDVGILVESGENAGMAASELVSALEAQEIDVLLSPFNFGDPLPPNTIRVTIGERPSRYPGDKETYEATKRQRLQANQHIKKSLRDRQRREGAAAPIAQ